MLVPEKIVESLVKNIDINELSRKTLTSYAKKASLDSFAKGVAGGAGIMSTDKGASERSKVQVNRAARRNRYVDKAIDRLAKEDLDALVEVLSSLTESEWKALDRINESRSAR